MLLNHFARALADATQRTQGLQKKKPTNKQTNKQTNRQFSDHFICLIPALSVLLFFTIERSVIIVLIFYYNGMLGEVSMQKKTQQFSDFSL